MKHNPEYQQFVPRETMRGLLLPTGSDILGPFYKEKAPYRNVLTGSPSFHLSGRVLDTDGKPIAAARLDCWQADSDGHYDMSGFAFRGMQDTDDNGDYYLHTVIPGDYDISEPGSPEPHDFRCAHIHVKIAAPGYKPLTTQLYFKDDKYNATDHWFNKDRVITQTSQSRGEFNFVLERAP